MLDTATASSSLKFNVSHNLTTKVFEGLLGHTHEQSSVSDSSRGLPLLKETGETCCAGLSTCSD